MDLADIDDQVDAFENLDAVHGHMEVFDLEQRRSHSSSVLPLRG
jgi:hypothetical protein